MNPQRHTVVAIAVTAILTVTLVVAFALFADGTAGGAGLPVAALAVAVLQLAAVMLVATLALNRARTRAFGWEAVGVAVVLTGFVVATAATGAGSGLSMALRPPIGLIGILAFALFDTGRPVARVDRLVTVPAALAAIGISLLIGVTATVTPGAWAALPCTDGCVAYGLGLVDAPWWSTSLQALYALLMVAACTGCIIGLSRRRRRALGWRRSIMRPLSWFGFAYAGIGIILTLPALGGLATELPLWIEPVLIVRRLILPLAIAGGMLAALLLQKQASGDGLVRLQDAADVPAVQAALQELVGDPDLRVVVAGNGTTPPGFVHTPLRSPGGDEVSCIEHRPARDGDEEEALAIAVPAAALAMDRIASRDRLRTASHDERARLERDLHDGAQQHLVALRMRLGLLEAQLADGPDEVREGLDDLVEQAEVALDELRLLAHGTHRDDIRRRGLRGALEHAAARSGVAADLTEVTDERMPPAVEEALYFAIREALQNAMKHGRGAPLRVNVQPLGRDMVFQLDDVVDDDDPCIPAPVPRTIAERIEGVGGSVEALASARGGRRITGHVPRAAFDTQGADAR